MFRAGSASLCHELVVARGHPNIKGTHKTTFEITKDPYVSPRGDCIIGVSATKASADLSEYFKACLRRDDAILVIVLEVGNIRDFVLAHGHSQLLLTDNRKIIVRRSSHVEPATIGIQASKSSSDLRRELISALKNPEATLVVHLYVLRLDQITSMNTQSW